MKSSVLAVGTELTDGQIINRNAAWIGARVKPLGLRNVLHLSVPDDRAEIRRGLELCAERSDVIFVTGGLGPTSDDFTRDVVSEWADVELEFHEPSWKGVQELLRSRGYEVHDFQKQQCFFPRGAVVLANASGTANGFRFHAKGKDIVVLPGPPREVESIWNDHVHTWIQSFGERLQQIETKSWDVIGLGESQVAAMMNPLVENLDLEVGYRVHLPYVEFKISYPVREAHRHFDLIRKIEEVLLPWIAARDQEDLAAKLVTKLERANRIEICDPATGAFLIQRLLPLFRRSNPDSSVRFLTTQANWTDETSVRLWIIPSGELEVQIGLESAGKRDEKRVVAPMTSPLLAERRQQYFAEVALSYWLQKI